MNTANLTNLRLGMTGVIDGRHYTVTGRALMSTLADGLTCKWTEFNVTDGLGGAATLVYENDAGPEWKLFRKMELPRGLTAAEAATKRHNDTVSFGLWFARVTLTSQSRVEFTEGPAPEDVSVGDTADYFNADSVTGDRLFVASWTGDEIEFFEGKNLLMSAISPQPDSSGNHFTAASKLRSKFNSGRETPLAAKIFMGLFLFMFIGFIILLIVGSSQSNTAPPPPPLAAPKQLLVTGTRGSWAGEDSILANHSLVQISEVGRKYDRHEYELVEAAGAPALLIQGLDAKAQAWNLFKPVAAPDNFTPKVAAALRPHQMIMVGGHNFMVEKLFLSSTLAHDGAGAAAGLRFGLVAKNGADCLLAEWNEQGIQVYLGQELSEAEVLSTQGPQPAIEK